MFGTLTPAYGRDYNSCKAALADWNADKDFVLNSPNGQVYVNRLDANKVGATSFQIRWKRLTETTVIKRKKDGTWRK